MPDYRLFPALLGNISFFHPKVMQNEKGFQLLNYNHAYQSDP